MSLRNILPPSSEQTSSTCYLLHAGFLLGLFFDPKDGGNMFLRNVGRLSMDYTALYPRRQNSSDITRMIKSQIMRLEKNVASMGKK
jgi:hypothetical protein